MIRSNQRVLIPNSLTVKTLKTKKYPLELGDQCRLVMWKTIIKV